MTARRLAGRRSLLADLGDATHTTPAAIRSWSELNERAWSLVDSTSFRWALDLEREPSTIRDRYGRHLFGEGLLLARRLIEADVPFVTVYWIDPTPPGPGGGEFDSHGHIYKHMRDACSRLPTEPFPPCCEDLWARGLQEDTLVVVMSEFGRHPG